jgi:ABC-type transporter Mla MlaB component
MMSFVRCSRSCSVARATEIEDSVGVVALLELIDTGKDRSSTPMLFFVRPYVVQLISIETCESRDDL